MRCTALQHGPQPRSSSPPRAAPRSRRSAREKNTSNRGSTRSGTGSGGRVLETGWRKDSTRIRAQATPDESGTHVVLTLLKEDTTEHGHDARERKPAVDLELQLAKKLDPAAAADIEAGLQAVKPD